MFSLPEAAGQATGLGPAGRLSFGPLIPATVRARGQGGGAGGDFHRDGAAGGLAGSEKPCSGTLPSATETCVSCVCRKHGADCGVSQTSCCTEISLGSRLQTHKQTQTTDLWKLPARRLAGCRGEPRRAGEAGPEDSAAQRHLPEIGGVGDAPPSLLQAVLSLASFWPLHLLSLRDLLVPRQPAHTRSHRQSPPLLGGSHSPCTPHSASGACIHSPPATLRWPHRKETATESNWESGGVTPALAPRAPGDLWGTARQ